MPTYDYQCSACGHRYEVFQRMSDRPKRTCPKCKGRVKRLIGTGAGLLFKGSGFYVTDYRSAGYRKDAKADVSPPASPAKSSDAAKAAKPETPSKKTAKAAGKA
jgi:putative FmdB family regulatory protein